MRYKVNVVQSGEMRDVDVYSHVNGKSGMNAWAGTARDGRPVKVDPNEWSEGYSGRKGPLGPEGA